MDERNIAKSRGRKHLKNKVKYKDKTKIEKLPEEETKDSKSSDEEEFPNRLLKSNWDRYKEHKGNDADTTSTNFALLAQAPISQGGHFQFQSDKDVFEEEVDEHLFQLNVNIINKSILTYPLTVRCDIPEDYFTAEQLEDMEKRAERHKKEYLDYLSQLKEQARKDSVNVKEELHEDIFQKEEIPQDTLTKPLKDMDIKDMKKEDLEEWLDDFLDS